LLDQPKQFLTMTGDLIKFIVGEFALFCLDVATHLFPHTL